MKIGIVGCGGTMGRLLVQEVVATEGCELAGGTGRPGSAVIGRDVAGQAGLEPIGLEVTADAEALFRAADAVIDFSVARAAPQHAKLAAKHGVALVHGASGLDKAQNRALARASAKTAVVQSANMSVGVNVLIGLAERVAGVLGEDYDIEILELFHNKKVDAPSGTSLALGRIMARARGVDLDNVAVFARQGEIGPRPKGAIGFASLRGGDSAGEHTVIFAGHGERVELVHRATSRAIYTRGAVRAALWCAGKAPGLYSMRDVLGV